jgi:hypothetical protein
VLIALIKDVLNVDQLIPAKFARMDYSYIMEFAMLNAQLEQPSQIKELANLALIIDVQHVVHQILKIA